MFRWLSARCGTLRHVAARCAEKTTQHAVLHRVQCERSLKGRSHVRCALLHGAGKTLLVFYQRSAAARTECMNDP